MFSLPPWATILISIKLLLLPLVLHYCSRTKKLKIPNSQIHCIDYRHMPMYVKIYITDQLVTNLNKVIKDSTDDPRPQLSWNRILIIRIRLTVM